MNTTLNISPDNNFVSDIEKFLGRILYKFTRLVAAVPWLVALFLLMTFGFFYTSVLYFPFLFFTRRNSRRLKGVVSMIERNALAERDGMMLNVKLEDIIPKVESITSRTKNLFVFQPIHAQLSILLNDMKETQRILFAYVYPDYNKELTIEEQEELREAFKPWNENSKQPETLLNHG